MNHYKVLQVDPSAEPEVVEAAYKRLAAKYHPDKNPSESATAKMKEINGAYDVLRDPARRARYDREQAASGRPPRPEVADDDDSDDDELDDDELDDDELDDDERSRPRREPRPVAVPTVEQVSNSVVKKLLGVGTIIALLVYLPWVAALIAGIWGTVWFVKKYPGVVRTLVRITVAIGVAVAIRYLLAER